MAAQPGNYGGLIRRLGGFYGDCSHRAASQRLLCGCTPFRSDAHRNCSAAQFSPLAAAHSGSLRSIVVVRGSSEQFTTVLRS
ncbi:hypothetical protein MRX96_014904 [Rhipicephalus microplus]